ncbi:uncharacterized protein LOC131884193 [Tigriopus californicus]|uniref:uncharacterized protein LOC131884193 n=1 Tax=Tigriopus californicus TaxID=6832 RepID=UPI0027DA6CD1|nr:uncharacterized protein LOC131884193 [Tigriopus californicus]XP_059087873.1 uncharacterized protein LOC131884193 [Tigriopus californicus]
MAIKETCQKYKPQILLFLAIFNLIWVGVILVWILSDKSACDTFPGSQSSVSFIPEEGNRITVVYRTTEGLATKEDTSENCRKSSGNEAQMWEVTSGVLETDYFLKMINSSHPDAWEKGIWLDAIYDQGQIKWKRHSDTQDSFTKDIAEQLLRKGTSNGTCLVVKGQGSKSGILPVPCDGLHYGLCVKQCPRD